MDISRKAGAQSIFPPKRISKIAIGLTSHVNMKPAFLRVARFNHSLNLFRMSTSMIAIKERAVNSRSAFKEAFGNGGNSLRDLLNAIYDNEILSIENVGEISRHSSTKNFLMCDICCTLLSGEKIIVEIEKFRAKADIIPLLFGYMAKDYSKQTDLGSIDSTMSIHREYVNPDRRISHADSKLMPVRIIGILDFQIDADAKRCGSFIQRYGVSVQKGQQASEAIAGELGRLIDFTILQLPLAPDNYESCETDAEKWSILMRDSDRFSEKNVESIPEDASQKHSKVLKGDL